MQLLLFLQLLMSHRSCRVHCATTLSIHFVMDGGDPHGSVIGFNGVVDTISNSIRGSVYVDDSTLYANGAKLPCMVRQLQLKIDKVSSGAVLVVSFSTSKTKVMLKKKSRQGSRSPSPPILIIYGSSIHIELKARFLDLQIDERLNYLLHIIHLKAHCSRLLNLLRHLTF